MIFIADIASNHDGDLNRAKDLICLAADSGANAVKFQYFRADTLISRSMKPGAHQTKWASSVYDTFKKYEITDDWLPELLKVCEEKKVELMITPYDISAVQMLDKFVKTWKIGSGDIDYLQLIDACAKTHKPVIISTGAATLAEVITAANIAMQNAPFALLQCNTNYEGKKENEKHLNVNVLRSYKHYFPMAALGLSDHTKSQHAIIAAIAYGATIFERHFTDGKSSSPDNDFAMTPNEWKYMVNDAKEALTVLGNNFKEITLNEKETRLIQRRGAYAKKYLSKGQEINAEDVIYLRPALGIPPFVQLVGRKTKKEILNGEPITFGDVE